MKKIHIIVLATAIIPFALYAVATLRTDSGFFYPSDKKHSASTYFGYGDKNPDFGNRCHLANDYNLTEGSPVYAVGPGVVQSTSTTIPFYGGDDGTPGGVIVVKYTKSDDTFFFALYGHIKNFSVAVGNTVVGGQQIAEVGAYTSGGNALPHLHFGISNNSPSLEGYTPTTSCTDYLGYVDPEPYLITNSPKLTAAETCTAVNDTDDTTKNTILTTANVLDNDTDTNSDTLSVSASDTNSANGAGITNNGDGTFTYIPAIDFTGIDSFNYTLTDNDGCNDQGTMTIAVTDDSTGSHSNPSTSDSGSGGGSSGLGSLMSLYLILLIRAFRKNLKL